MHTGRLGKTQAKFLKRTEDGWHICFPRNNAEAAMVLLHSTVPYLGIKLSYKTLQSSFVATPSPQWTPGLSTPSTMALFEKGTLIQTTGLIVVFCGTYNYTIWSACDWMSSSRAQEVAS